MKENLLSDWTLVALKTREEERRRIEQAELAEAMIKHEQGREGGVDLRGDAEAGRHSVPWAEAARRAKKVRRQREEGETIRRAERERLLREREETRAVPKRGIAPVEGTHKIARGFSSILITSCIAGAIGFGVGVYVGPTKEAAKIRAQIQGGLDSIYEAVHQNKDNNKIQPAKAPQKKAPVGTETPR